MQNEIINILPNSDDYLIGFADMGDLIKDHYPYRYAVVIGKRLDDSIINEIEDGPTMPYFELYQATNDELNLITTQISRYPDNGKPLRHVQYLCGCMPKPGGKR